MVPAQAKKIAIIGSGPAGLMAADVLAEAGHAVTLFEKRKSLSWKLFVAGGSGLNITNGLPLEAFASHYTGPADFWLPCLQQFSPQNWLDFIEKKLEVGTFLGTSNRYFVETMHAAKLVRQWRRRLEALAVGFVLDAECIDFQRQGDEWQLHFRQQPSACFDALGFCLGGGSYEKLGTQVHWPEMFRQKGLSFREFSPSNTGYEVHWSEAFLKEAEGQPLKNILLRSSRGERKGDLVITSYGLEGTPIYFLGEVGEVGLDLKPDLNEAALLEKLSQTRENLSPMRRAQKLLQLNTAAKALLYHQTTAEQSSDIKVMASTIKNFPLRLLRPRPLSESISSQGGLTWDNLDRNLMIKTHPAVYCAGEMLDWDAPTGGFLIQGCASQGFAIGKSILQAFQ